MCCDPDLKKVRDHTVRRDQNGYDDCVLVVLRLSGVF